MNASYHDVALSSLYILTFISAKTIKSNEGNMAYHFSNFAFEASSSINTFGYCLHSPDLTLQTGYTVDVVL